MRIVWRGTLDRDQGADPPFGGPAAALGVRTVAEDASVADLATALGLAAAEGLVIDGRWFSRELALSETAWCDGVDVAARGGHRASGSGTGEGMPPAAIDPVAHASTIGLVPFNRPPRSVPGDRPATLVVPAPAGEPVTLRFAVASVVVPVVMAAVFVALTGSWAFAALSAVAPVVAVATWWTARRRNRRLGRLAGADYRAEIERFRQRLGGEVALETARRRVLAPGVDAAVARARGTDLRLWERRPGDRDAWAVSLGIADLPWCPPLEPAGVRFGAGEEPAPEVASAVSELGILRSTPVVPDLLDGGVIGVVGAADRARAVGRSLLLQLAVHHGPADLSVCVVGNGGARRAWRWAAWLPHTRGDDGRPQVAWDDDAPALALELLDRSTAGAGAAGARAGAGAGAQPPRLLVVVDGAELVTGRRSPVRDLLRGLGGPVIGVVITPDRDHLPSTCTTVVELPEEARSPATVHDLRTAAVLSCAPEVLDLDRASASARALARFEDPERGGAGGRLPIEVGLGSLLDDGPTHDGQQHGAAAVTQRWQARTVASRATLRVPVGVGPDGVVELDLVRDGPHALVAGTTGSGKSELLRSWVAAMAACYRPEELNLLLVDYKGGSAFDACARLPHVVGVVTDLDEHLAARALRCLDAELRLRERSFRLLGAGDLDAYRQRRDAARDLSTAIPSTGSHVAGGDTAASLTDEPPLLSRLVVVVDEFATLAAELPDFLDALVGVAQRGRSLGVHLVLATQRPHGAVNDNIRANTNLRIALRMTDRADSLDVVGDDAAASLSPSVPGRAVVRRGPGTPVTMQTASTGGPAPDGIARRVELVAPTWSWAREARPGDDPVATTTGDRSSSSSDGSARSELDALVDAVARAAAGMTPLRMPWLPPLPDDLPLTSVAAASGPPGTVPLWLADDPDEQRGSIGGWEPAAGNLLVYGAVGSGTTTTLRTIALQVAAQRSPDGVHLYVIDSGGGLGDLARLPHVGGVVSLGDGERLERLVRRLTEELRTRRMLTPAACDDLPRVVVLVDGVRAVLAELDADPLSGLAEQLTRVLCDGPAVGISAALVGDAATAIRHQVASGAAQRLVLRLADPTEARQLGVRRSSADRPGRAVDVRTGLEVQVARATGAAEIDAAIVAAIERVERSATRPIGPAPIGRLPDHVTSDDLAPATCSAQGVWELPVGIDAADLGVASLVCHPGEHVLVAGPPRSGRSTVLAHLVSSTAAAGARVLVFSPADAGPAVRAAQSAAAPASGVATIRSIPELAAQLAGVADDGRSTVVAIDDVERVDDPDGTLVAALCAPGVLLLAAGRADALRSAYGHWTRAVRAARLGVLLDPDVDLDGDLLGVRLPRRWPVAPAPGRGFVVANGSAHLAQLAQGARPLVPLMIS